MNSKNSDNKWIKALTFIVTISLALNVILIIRKTSISPSKKKLKTEITQLDKKVYQYKTELNKLKGISDKIDQIINDANLKLEAKEKQIHNIKSTKEKEIKTLVIQVDSLKEKYLSAIDSLLVEREMKKLINTKIEDLEETIAQLNRKLGYAGWMIADNFKVIPLKKSGNPTAIAKRVQKLNICFDILENRITKPGIKNIYIIITSPDAKVISDISEKDKKFNHPEYKKLAEYSLLDQLNYDNKKMNFCTEINPNVELGPGLYVAEIYTDKYKLAMTTFSLK